MSEGTQDDIRKLLRGFGIRADEAIREHLAGRSAGGTARLRIVLEDVTEAAGPKRLLEVEGEVRE